MENICLICNEGIVGNCDCTASYDPNETCSLCNRLYDDCRCEEDFRKEDEEFDADTEFWEE